MSFQRKHICYKPNSLTILLRKRFKILEIIESHYRIKVILSPLMCVCVCVMHVGGAHEHNMCVLLHVEAREQLWFSPSGAPFIMVF